MVLEELVVRFPDQIRAHNLDVSDRDGLREICERTASEHGHVDACVAAAAIIEGGEALWEMSPDRFGNLCEVNIAGVWNTITAVIPLMLRNNASAGLPFCGCCPPRQHIEVTLVWLPTEQRSTLWWAWLKGWQPIWWEQVSLR